MKRATNSQVAQVLNLCDRVEVLSDIVHDELHTMCVDTFDHLMDQFYPCLDQFCRDIKHEKDVVRIEASFQEDSATFTARYADQSTKPFTYMNLDPDTI